ncbi:MAG: hypothetical protein ACTSUR_03765 [Candidatus Heimdallarchaeaceae archaeon]
MRKEKMIIEKLKGFLSELEEIKENQSIKEIEKSFNQLQRKFLIFEKHTFPSKIYEPGIAWIPRTKEGKNEKLAKDINDFSEKIHLYLYEIEEFGLKKMKKKREIAKDFQSHSWTFLGISTKITRREAKFIFRSFIISIFATTMTLLGIFLPIIFKNK